MLCEKGRCIAVGQTDHETGFLVTFYDDDRLPFLLQYSIIQIFFADLYEQDVGRGTMYNFTSSHLLITVYSIYITFSQVSSYLRYLCTVV